MPDLHTVLVLAVVAMGLALVPGPNMAYLLTRSLTQGPRAGLVSMAGTNLATTLVMLASVAGLAAALLAVPHLWDAIRVAGAAYLLWMAWGHLKPGGTDLLAARDLPPDPSGRLFAVGFMTQALNPKVAMFYVAGLPHLVDPGVGNPVAEAVILGFVQIGICALCDLLVVLGAGRVARFLRGEPRVVALQRYAVGGALGLVAVALLFDSAA